MKISAAYIRVSDERQDEYSPDSQLKLVREFANRNDYYVPEEYIYYDDGVSAKSTRGRNQFNEMIALAEKKDHPFDAIIVWKFSRFARNEEDSILLKSRLRKNGVSVLSVSEPINESDEYSGLIERFIEWDDAHYLRRLSQEVKRGMLEKASRGEPMSRQYGYDLVDKQLIPNADAETVRNIFTSYVNGEGERSIAWRLGQSGVKTSRGNPPDNRWVEYLIRNPVYIGKIRWSTNGRAASKRNYSSPDIIIIDGHHAPIIDMDTWNAAQNRLDIQKQKYGRYQRKEQPIDFELKGLVRCSACGATLCRQNHYPPEKPALQCHQYSKGLCGVSHHLDIEKATQAVIANLQECVLSLDFTIVPHEPEAEQIKIDYDLLIKKEKNKLAKVKEAYLAEIDTIEEYRENKKRILAEIAALEAEQSKVLAPAKIDKKAYAKKVASVVEILKSATIDPKAKNDALRSILAQIVYNKREKHLDLFFYA